MKKNKQQIKYTTLFVKKKTHERFKKMFRELSHDEAINALMDYFKK